MTDTTQPVSTTSQPEAGSTVVLPACATEDLPFTQEGTIGSGGVAESDAALIESFAWEVLDGCERFRISFTTPEGAPAVSPPVVGAQFFRHAGVVRIDYAGAVVDSAVVEQIVATELVKKIIVFSTPAGTIATDLHLEAPAFARVATERSPASLVIDLIPGGPAYPAPAQESGGTVILGPDPATVGYPITVTGYAEPGTVGPLIGTLESGDGTVVTGESAVAEAAHAWGAFAMVFPDGPSGAVTISIEDGPSIELTVP